VDCESSEFQIQYAKDIVAANAFVDEEATQSRADVLDLKDATRHLPIRNKRVFQKLIHGWKLHAQMLDIEALHVMCECAGSESVLASPIYDLLHQLP
jgi:hypothetical protein